MRPDPVQLMSDGLLRQSGSAKTVTMYRFAAKTFSKHLDLSPSDLLDKIGSDEIHVAHAKSEEHERPREGNRGRTD